MEQNQNVIHLFHLFSTFVNCRRCYSGFLGGQETLPPEEGFMLDGLNLKYAYIEDVIDQLRQL